EDDRGRRLVILQKRAEFNEILRSPGVGGGLVAAGEAGRPEVAAQNAAGASLSIQPPWGSCPEGRKQRHHDVGRQPLAIEDPLLLQEGSRSLDPLQQLLPMGQEVATEV